mmetsp:Transcript_73329/g.110638  ORF Transcript_73329/g.110638 Transcript_73329/m.110638 type:complete len:103 (-) Transcript_73329:111-419(-)
MSGGVDGNQRVFFVILFFGTTIGAGASAPNWRDPVDRRVIRTVGNIGRLPVLLLLLLLLLRRFDVSPDAGSASTACDGSALAAFRFSGFMSVTRFLDLNMYL